MREKILTRSGIYMIKNIENGKFYIGSAIDFSKRKNNHFTKLQKGIHENKHLQSSYNKYGEDNFKFIIIEFCNKEELVKREQYFIDELKPQYNKCPIAGNTFGLRASEETKEKMRKTRMAIAFVYTDEVRKKMSEKMMGNNNGRGNKGKKYKRSPEIAKGIGSILRGRKQTEEARKHMSAAQKGRIITEEHRRNLSIALKGRPCSRKGLPGHKHTEETKKQMLISQRERRERERIEKELKLMNKEKDNGGN